MREEYVEPLFKNALNKLGVSHEFELEFEEPKVAEHGDLSTNAAMKLASVLKLKPRVIAVEIISNLKYDNTFIKSIDIAGPGFINIKFTNFFYAEALLKLYEQGRNIGKSNIGERKKINVEYVSVNPTGLLHLGHGRNAAIGDTVANLLEWLGFDVTREYYFNNAGNQMNVLGRSIYARYRQQLDNPNYPFPEEGYHGEYIKDIASEIIEKFSNKLINGEDSDIAECRIYGEHWCFERIMNTLARINVEQDVFFNEDSLYHEGKIEKLINDLKDKELAYEKDGALWLSLSSLGLSDDRVIVKSTGEPTYRLPDIAYHKEKFERGYDLLIDVFGSDHIATFPDVLAAIGALGYDSSKIQVLIHQFVTLTEGGEQVKMSKRTGKNYTLDDLLDEVGADVVRFFLIMRGITTHLEFDLSLAREQSEKNPVFYLQYAHARICSVFENAKERGIELKIDTNFSLLTHPSEISLMKELLKFTPTVQNAGQKCEPQVLADYLRGLAAAFHIFYHECRILGSLPDLEQARLKLALVTKNAMKNGLTILGISAPEKM